MVCVRAVLAQLADNANDVLSKLAAAERLLLEHKPVAVLWLVRPALRTIATHTAARSVGIDGDAAACSCCVCAMRADFHPVCGVVGQFQVGTVRDSTSTPSCGVSGATGRRAFHACTSCVGWFPVVCRQDPRWLHRRHRRQASGHGARCGCRPQRGRARGGRCHWRRSCTSEHTG